MATGKRPHPASAAVIVIDGMDAHYSTRLACCCT